MSRMNLWFVPGHGIARDVITADIQRYLGSDATVRPGPGTGEWEAVDGYWISAYRSLTGQMVQDLKLDSTRWWQERPKSPINMGGRVHVPELTRNEIAELCGWQVGKEKFLGEGRKSTSLKMTTRGTLGRGGFGIVEEVFTATNHPVVQKRVHIPRRKEQAQRYRKMIEDEIGNLKNLNHKHIIKLLGSYEERKGTNDVQVCVLMWPSGDEDLGMFLEEVYPNAKVAVKQNYSSWIRSWFPCLASALKYMHSQGVHHEDIKPANIVHLRGTIYFTDFSSSRKLQNNQDTSTTSPALATRMFAAPEALPSHSDGATLRHGSGTDVYSLGLVFFEMLLVLHGHALEEVRTALFADHSEVKQYHLVISRFQDEGAISTDPALMWFYDLVIRPMLKPDRKLRPSVLQVISLLSDTNQVSSCSCWTPWLHRLPDWVASPHHSRDSNLNLVDYDAIEQWRYSIS